jgi:hypothetical protein
MSADVSAAPRVAAAIVAVLLFTACKKNETAPAPSAPTGPATAAFTVTFSENPVPFQTTGCNGSISQGWYTTARVQETAGVAFTPNALTQKLDGAVTSVLADSFASRFGACPGAAFTSGTIAASGAVCAIVGVCTLDTYRTYQFDVTGTDANGHALTISSPMLQFGARAAVQALPLLSLARTWSRSIGANGL